MANNLVVQLLLKTGTFSTDLKKAGGEINQFKKSCSDASKGLAEFGRGIGINLGSLGKIAGTVGAAVAAFNAFKAVMQSTDTTADKFDNAIAGCKGVIDQLKVSLATADFGAFSNGLWGVFDAAVNARNALDALQDAQLAIGYFNATNADEFDKQALAYRQAKQAAKKATTPEERQKYEAEMEAAVQKMRDIIASVKQDASLLRDADWNSITADIVKRAGSTYLNQGDIKKDWIIEALNIKKGAYGDPDKMKEQIDYEAERYRKDVLSYRYWDWSDMEYKWNNPIGRDTYMKRNARPEVISVLLDMPQDQLNAMVEKLLERDTSGKIATSMEARLTRLLDGELEPITPKHYGGGTTTNQKVDYPEGTLGHYKQKKSEAIDKYEFVKTYEEYEAITNEVKQWQAEIDKITTKQGEDNELLETQRAYYEDIIKKQAEIKVTADKNSEAYKNAVNEIARAKRALLGFDLSDALLVDPPTLESLKEARDILIQIREKSIDKAEYDDWTKQIKEYVEKIKAIEGDNSNTNIKAPSTSSWSTFGNTLSGVANIASSMSTIMRQLIKDEEDSLSGWNDFMNAVSIGISIFQAVAGIIQTVSSLTQTYGAISAATAATKVAADAATATSTTVAAGTEVAANTAVAASGAAASQAGVPIVGPALAIAAIAAIIAAIVAATSSAKAMKFATGGIVPGSSFTGDRVSAQVNSGEMILNRSQQARLFELANGGGTGGQVEFHISGTELVGVLNNQNRKNRLIR